MNRCTPTAVPRRPLRGAPVRRPQPRAKAPPALPRALLACLLAVALAPSAAQTLRELQHEEGVPAAMQPGLKTLSGYYEQVQQRTQAAPARVQAAPERDPFQVTPELRARRMRDGALAAVPAEATGGDDWQVQALALGARAMAVLVRAGAGAARESAAVEGTARTPARGGASLQKRYVRVGDTLDMPDGRSWRVVAIDREGVLVQGSSAEIDMLRIR